MKNYYFTFPCSSSLANGYMIVPAASYIESRQKMIDTYGKITFAFQYEEAEFLPQIPKYDLYEIPFGYMPEDSFYNFERTK